MTQIRNKLNSKSKNQDNSSSNFNEELLDEILKDYNHQNPEELIGSNGLLKQLKKALIQRALEGEMTHHLGYEKHSKSNRNNPDFDNNNYRNGHGSKRVITDDGEFNINSPRDRNGSFEPQIIGKRQNRFLASLKILFLGNKSQSQAIVTIILSLCMQEE